MSGNKLLAESTIRRFMKLASVDAMTDGFISEMGMKYTNYGRYDIELIKWKSTHKKDIKHGYGANDARSSCQRSTQESY